MLFKKYHIPVIRMGLQPSEELDNENTVLAGPYHPSFGERVYSSLFLDMARNVLEASQPLPKSVTLRVHPQSVSKMRGYKNRNLQNLDAHFKGTSIHLVTDTSVSEDNVALAYG